MYELISRSQLRRYWLFIITDLIGYQLSFIAAFFIRNGLLNPYGSDEYLRLALIMAVAAFVVSWSTNCYGGIMERGMLVEFRNVAGYNTIVMVALVVILFLAKESTTYSRIILGLTWLIAMAALTALRLIAKRLTLSARRHDSSTHRLLVITTSDSAERTVNRIMKHNDADYRIVGMALLDTAYAKSTYAIPVVAFERNIMNYINSEVIDGVLISESCKCHLADEIAEMSMDMGISVHHEIQTLRDSGSSIVEEIGDCIVITSSMRIISPRQAVTKRLMDIIGGVIGSVFALILIVIFTPVIKVQSPGPVIFKQTRVGKAGRHFTIYKLRTMHADADKMKTRLANQNKMQGLMFKVDDDPRVYPFGRFLRRSSLDEVPQFFNVLMGNMSLVGTRPPTVDEYVQYESKHKKRLSIKPGITGLWQTSGRSKITDFDEIIRLDVEYIKSWRILLDIKILLKTIGVVLKGNGAQ